RWAQRLPRKKNYFSLAPKRRARSGECRVHSRRREPESNAHRRFPPPPGSAVTASEKKRRLPERHARLSPHASPHGTQQAVANPLGLSLARLANRPRQSAVPRCPSLTPPAASPLSCANYPA